MKARVLSLLLLLAMLITAIPVAISAEEAEEDVATVLPENVTNPELADLHEYYVQDGLVALFSAFDSASVDFENAIWQNKVKDGEDATFRDAATPYWELQNGGIGYTMLPAEWDADAQKVGISLSDSYEHMDNYTVEAFATIVGITDENGDRFVNHYQPVVKDEAGNVITPASGRQYGWYKSGDKASSAFRFGLVYSLFFCSLMDNPAANDSIGSRWFICNYGYVDGQPSGDKGYVITNEAGWREMGTPTVPAAGTMQVYKKTATDAETSVTSVNHRLTYNGGTNAFNTTFTKEQEAIYLSQSSTDLSSRFSLFNATPSTVYSIRVYGRELTAAELKQNHSVDVMLYYGLEIPASVGEDVKDYLCAQFATVPFLTYGSEEYTAKQAELQATVDWRVGAEEIISLYAQRDHMTSLFTVYHDGTLDMTAGTWTDLVGGGHAKLESPSRWFQNANGSFGYNAFAGYIDANGNKSTLGTTVNIDLTAIKAAGIAPENHLYYEENYLNIGIDRLPTEDYTVEYMAMYRPVLVADAAKSTSTTVAYAKDADGNLLEAYEVFGTSPVTTDYGSSTRGVDAIGWYSSHSQKRDADSGWDSTRGSIHWYFDNHFWGTHNTYALTNYTLAFSGNAFQQNDVIRVYGITLDETYNESTSVTTAVFGLYRDAVKYGDTSADPQTTECLTAKTRYYTEFTSACQFYLSSARPTDFYAVRIYDRLLTEEEMEQNLLVDKMLYYGLKISPETLKDEAKMRVITAAVKREDFASDAAAKAAKTAELQAIIDGEAYRADFASLFAARENLTALFTTYIPGTLNLRDGVWTDLIKGEQAQLGNPQRWQRGEFGGVGFNTFCGEVIMGLAFTKESSNNNYAATGTKLNIGKELLPASDLTVDYLAMYKPVYVHDVQSKDGIARDADGNKLETYDFDPEATGLHLERTPIDQIGWFSSYESSCDGIGYKPWGAAPRGSVHWLYDCSSWYASTNGYGNNSNWVGKKWTAAGGLNKLDDTLRRNKEIRTYSILLDETLTVAEDGTRTTTALFALYRDALFYNSNEAEGVLNSTANGDKYGGYRDIDTVGTSGSFWLSATHPTDFFTVRVYNKALTEAEMAHNRTADLLYYYGVTVPDSLYGNDAAMTALAAEISTLPFATDAAAIAANKALIESKLDAMKTPVPVTLNGKDAGTLTAIGSTLRLPERCDGKKAFAWRVNGATYFSGATLTLSEGMTVAAITVDAPVTEALPTAYVTDKEAELGIRFAAAFSYAEYRLLLDTFGADAVKTGILITPRAYVNMANGVFTREALTAMVEASASVSRAAYVTVEAAPKQDGELARLAGVLYDFKQPTLQKDPHFTAIAYIDVDTNGDGDADFTVYGENSPTVGATVRETLTAAREGLPARAQGWIDTLLGKFAAQ